MVLLVLQRAIPGVACNAAEETHRDFVYGVDAMSIQTQMRAAGSVPKSTQEVLSRPYKAIKDLKGGVLSDSWNDDHQTSLM